MLMHYSQGVLELSDHELFMYDHGVKALNQVDQFKYFSKLNDKYHKMYHKIVKHPIWLD
jgi:hypothetical protein